MNRTELHRLAEDRLIDAQTLLAGQRWAAAHYLAGYALECGLKACILAYIEQTGVIFKKGNKRFVEECFTHDLKKLVSSGGLSDELDLRLKSATRFPVRWAVVVDWNEESRYQQKTQQEAEELIEAITDNTGGVLAWIKLHR